MNDVKDLIKNRENIDSANFKSFQLAMEDEHFASLALNLNLKEEDLMKYTSKLTKTTQELKNCKGCKGLQFCKNTLQGYVDFPSNKDGALSFAYTPCKYKKEEDKNKSNVIFYETSEFLKNAKMKNIYLDDEARVDVLKYIQKFMKNYPKEKGIYLYGSFGSGKSYILNALINELSKKGSTCVSIYYPTLLKKLKDSFSSNNISYEQVYNELETSDILLIDDIGAENNTAWSRDEVLGSLLQSRMDNNKITFFTSNFNLEELEEHLSMTTNGVEKIKARRIIERIKQLSNPIALIGENKRNS